MVMLYRSIILKTPLPPAVEIRLRVRYTDVQPGQQPWFDARVISHFKDASGGILKPEPETPFWRGSSKGWVERAYVAKFPRVRICSN